MQSILTDRALWCSHICSFNDPSEILHGQGIIVDILTTAMRDENCKHVRRFLSTLQNQVNCFYKDMFHLFIACFCESGDLLSQWRAYGDGGDGTCLGFRFSSTTRIAQATIKPKEPSKEEQLFLRKVIYDESDQRKLVQEYVNGLIEASRQAFRPERSNDKAFQASMMAMEAANPLMEMLVSFKHPAFKEEQEWRLVRATAEYEQPESLQFRKVGNSLTAYRSTNIYDLTEAEPAALRFPLERIVFGPSWDPRRIRPTIELLIHHIASDGHPINLIPHAIAIKSAGYKLA